MDTLSPNLLYHFKLGQTWSEPKTFQILRRAFASTHPLMLPSTFSGEILFACPPSLSWNLPSFIVEIIVSSPCLRQDAALANSLPPHNPVLCSFFTQAALASLPIAFFVALSPLSPFRKAQLVQVFSAEVCKLFAGLGNTNKSATFHLFSGSRSILATSFLLLQSL